LEEEEYGRFCEELPLIPSAIYPGKRMVDGMRGTPAHKRKVAWRHYLGAKLRSEGFGPGSLWQRKYLVLEEFYAYIGSFAELHFGARFPLRFRNLQTRCRVSQTTCVICGDIYTWRGLERSTGQAAKTLCR
jgi:hypothetical protein